MQRTPGLRTARPRIEPLEARDVPSFLPPVNYLAGSGARQPVIADFNGDGRRDVAIAFEGDDQVAVLLGDGTGALGVPAHYPTGRDPWGLEAADVNLDSNLDLVVANLDGWYGTTLSVLLGNGDGSFKPKADFPVAEGPLRVSVGDLNADGNPDIAASIWGEYKVASVLHGNGDGTFQPYFNLPAATWSVGVDIGDVDNDGTDDLTVSAGFAHVFYGNGTSADFCCSAGNWAGHTLGDVNRDGYLDIVSGYTFGTPYVTLLINRGDGTYKPPIQVPTAPSPTYPLIADFNRDRKPDIAAVNKSEDKVSIALGNGDGTFKPYLAFAVETYEAFNMAVGDLNNDRRPDLVVPSYGPGFHVLLNDGDWTLPIPPPPRLAPPFRVLDDMKQPARLIAPPRPAIDAGDNTDAPEWDQRGPGFPRIVNGTIDIGAFEVQASPIPSASLPGIDFLAIVVATADFDLDYLIR